MKPTTTLSFDPSPSGRSWVLKWMQIAVLALASVFAAANLSAQSAEINEVIELDLLTVKGRSGYGYNAARSATGTRSPIPIADTPISIQVVTRQILEDQAAQGLEDVFKNISGVVESGNTLNAQSEVRAFIRGFESQVTLRNGMRATNVGAVDLTNIETVEVLKGPASILYGALQPGGILNITTKRPSEIAFTRIEQSVGSYDRFRTTIDSTGPLNDDRTVLYRVNIAYTNSGSFRDEIDTKRFMIAPSFAWRPSEKTDVAFDFTYSKETVAYDSGIPVDANGKRLVEADTFFGDPDLDGRTLEDWFAGYHLNHRINDSVTFRNRLQYHLSEPRNQSIRNRGVIGDPGAEMLRQRYQDEERSDDEIQFVADLLMEFQVGESEHTAILGFDYLDQNIKFNRFRMNLPNIPVSSNPNVDFAPPNEPRTPVTRTSTSWLALYAQDQISLQKDGRLKALIGGRLDMVEDEDHLSESSADNDEFTGRIGLLYKANNTVSPYVSLTQSFLPNPPNRLDRTGSLLAPETGVQYEAGLKFDFSEHGLLATVSTYKIEKEDVGVFDTPYFNETGEQTWLPSVDQESSGIEIDISGQITENLSIIANYAYTEAETTASILDPGSVGTELGNVPDSTLRIWSAYNFESDSSLDGLGLGLGARFEGSRSMAFNPIELDSYTVIDAAIWYTTEADDGRQYTARLNLANVFDEDYIVRASDPSIAHPGTPFSINATFGIGF